MNQATSRATNRLANCFARLAAAQRKALVTYLVAGDPAPQHTVGAMHALVRGGVDIIELGVPFSDPEAEGPTIQAGHERALAQGVKLHHVLAMASEFRATDSATPIVLMGYINVIERMGYDRFAVAAAAAGIDALIMVNLPPEEAEELRVALAPHGIVLVFLLAPTTTRERARYIASKGEGFLYFVALKGITGADHIDTAQVTAQITALRDLLPLPIVIGFGIKDPATARVLAPVANGVVLGAALVSLMASSPPDSLPERITAWADALRRALDA